MDATWSSVAGWMRLESILIVSKRLSGLESIEGIFFSDSVVYNTSTSFSFAERLFSLGDTEMYFYGSSSRLYWVSFFVNVYVDYSWRVTFFSRKVAILGTYLDSARQFTSVSTCSLFDFYEVSVVTASCKSSFDFLGFLKQQHK